MRNLILTLSAAAIALSACSSETATEAPEAVKEAVKEAVTASKTDLCVSMGPQTPRDISNVSGKNLMEFAMAPELKDPMGGNGAYKGVKPGDTIEVHWVHTSCDITPGEGLGSCLSDTCTDPLLRVEAQTFLVVNDPENALDFTTMDYKGKAPNGMHQPGFIPSDTGTPVVFRGSTTGPSFDQSTCSPLKVTWSQYFTEGPFFQYTGPRFYSGVFLFEKS